MKLKSVKTTIIFNLLIVVFLFCSSNFAQSQPTVLSLNSPINAEIKGGDIQIYSVDLSADKTAVIEVVQNGIDINFEAYDLQDKPFIVSLSPSGLNGDDSILVTAKESGVYRVDVSAADPRSKLGRYTIVLKEIRPTTEEDFKINEASAKILQLAQEATQLKYKGYIEGLRNAIAKWNEVIEVSKIKKDRVWEGVALVAQGLIYAQMGKVQSALDVHLMSLEIWRELKNRQYEGSSVNNIGNSYSNIGEYEKSILYFEQALKIQREVDDIASVGFTTNNMGFSYMMMGNFDKAQEFYALSLEIKKQNETPRGQRSTAITLNNLGKSFILKGEVETGIAYQQQALELRRKVEHHWGVANSLLNLGKIQWDSGMKADGFKNLEEANLRAKELGDRRLEAESFYLLALVENEKGNTGLAIEHISKGLEIIEQIRGELVGSQSRYTYFSTVQNYYDLYTNLLISRYETSKNKDDVALALQLSERSRSRSLVELLQEARVDFRNGNNPKLLNELSDLQDELDNKFVTRENLLDGKPSPEQITKLNFEINDLNTNIQNLQLKMRRQNPKFADLTQGKTNTASEIQSLLDNDTVLLEFKLGEKRSFLWLVKNNSIEVFELPKRKDIELKARKFYDLVVANNKRDQNLTVDISKELSNILLSQIAAKIENKRLAIVADGVMQYLPFSALPSPTGKDQLLIETNEIVLLSSASVLAQLRSNANDIQTNNKTIAIFADPIFDIDDSRVAGSLTKIDKNTSIAGVLRDFRLGETLPRLLATREEAKNISNLVDKDKVDVKMDFQANIDNIENSNLKSYKILHFATHGLLNSNRPELSGLVFSLYDEKGNKQNGYLTLNDIYNLDLSSDLVVLSACQTALGKEVRGEGLIGMSRGFLYAGSKRIMASLWKVDDSATAEFMKRFYTNHLKKGMPATQALQQTKIEMKKIPRYRSPYYWSAFTIHGDWK